MTTDVDEADHPAGHATPTSIRAVAALEDELRRGMFEYIRQAPHPVTRDEAAGSVGISRKLAAFHLDKLVSAGVLRAEYQAAGGSRRVGRAPKVYAPAGRDIQVSIPPRQHDVLAGILLDAVLTEGEAESGRDAAMRAAAERGRGLGARQRERLRPGRLGAERALTAATGILDRHGFEPARTAPTCVRLRNCPFHPLAARTPGLVCELNLAFLGGVLEGLEATGVRAALDPRAGECCVELRPA
ncbi:MAG TPA: transcriptional regulator [Streptosporangiaceae bacterium]|nr:transcriptional regulator [Streptosporangiaceae bacterium]